MNGWDSLFDRIGAYGEERYGQTGRKVFEELGLSIASLKLRREYGLVSNNVPMLRHPLLFGPTEHLKSTLPRRFFEDLLPAWFNRTEIHTASSDALEGSVTRNKITPSALSANEMCQLEFDSLATKGNADEIRSVLYKALNEGRVSKHLLSVDRADIEDDAVETAADEFGVTLSRTELRSPVNSLIIGVVHLGSEFWENNDLAFFRRWFPIEVRFQKGYAQDIRERAETADMDPEPIRQDMTRLFETSLSGEFNSAPSSLYGERVADVLGAEGFRVVNPLNVSLSCKALLDGKVEDGEIVWDEDDKTWLSNRIRDQYRHEYKTYEAMLTPQSRQNAFRRASRLENEWEVLDYLNDVGEATLSEIQDETGISKPTLSRYFNDEKYRLSSLVSKEKKSTTKGTRQMYHLDLDDDDSFLAEELERIQDEETEA